MGYIKGFGSELLFILTEMAPYLMLGFFFAGLLHLLFQRRRLENIWVRTISDQYLLQH